MRIGGWQTFTVHCSPCQKLVDLVEPMSGPWTYPEHDDSAGTRCSNSGSEFQAPWKESEE